MRVLHVIETLGRGGAETALLALIPALRTQGVHVDVAVLAPPYDLQHEYEKLGVEVFRLEVGRSWALHKGGWRIGRILRTRRYDILHSHLFHATMHAGASWVFAPRPRRTSTLHSLEYRSHPAIGARKRLRRALHAWVFRNAFHGALAVSRAVADHYALELRLHGIEVVPNPVNLGLVAGARRDGVERLPPWWNSDASQFTLVLPGRLVPEKGHLDALVAVNRLRAAVPDVHLYIVGDGPCHDIIADEVRRLGLESYVSIHAAVAQDVLVSLFCAADLAIFPSLREGFGLAAAEASAAGCPVLGTRCGGLEEVIVHGVTGLLVSPGSPLELAVAIGQFAGGEVSSKAMGEAGRELVAARFSPIAVASSLHGHYRRLYRRQ